MPKKTKRKPPKPTLSPLNKFLYWVLMILGILLVFSSVILFAAFQQALGKANNAIAVAETWTMLLLLPPMIYTLAIVVMLWYQGYKKRVPLIPAGEGTLTWKEKKQAPAKRRTIIFAVLLWLLSFVPAIGAVYNRVEINDTHIDTYAMFGRLEEHRPLEDATAVHATIQYSYGTRYSPRGWEISYTVSFADGASFTFQKKPSIMLEIDALFPDVPKTVEGTENFEKLCREFNCTEEAREQLKALFLMDD